MSNHHHQSGGSLSAPRANRNIPTNSGSISPSNHNAVSNHSNGNKRPRVHPPLHERSRNARAQARHRAKRKAYILQLEETVTRLQAALSPNQPFNTSFTSAAAAGSPSASSNDQSQSSLGIPLSSPSTLPNALGNAMIGIGPHPAVGKGSPGSADVVAARFRAIELECSALRTYAETLRGLLGQHTPNVQLPPPPLPSSLPPSASATTTGPPSLHSGLGLGSGPGEALPSLISTFPSAPTSTSPSCHRADTSEKIAGVKRPRRESHSRSLSASGSGTDREGGEGSNFSTGGGELGYTVTPPLNSKPSASGGSVTGAFPHSGVNSYTNTNTSGHPPQLTLPPLPPSQPAPVPPYTYGSNQSQQPLSSPLPMQQQHQHQQHQQHSSQPQSNSAHTSTHSQPQMTPMPPPAPSWGSSLGASSVPSHGNNSVHTHLQLPPPIPRLNPTSTMPSLTRGFAYPSNASSPSARQEGLDGSSNTDRNRFGSFSGGVIGTALGGASMVLKREEDHDPGLPVNMHASGRHQHHESFESIHSISPTSATATSPSSAIPQEHYHAQIPSPQGHHTYQHPQQPSAAQRLLPSPVPHQNHQTQSHYSHHTSVPTVSQPTQHQQHAHHHQNQPLQVQQPHHQQQSAPAHGLPSPHSPYPPISPSVPAAYRGYQEERYHHPSQPNHQHGHEHQQGQNQNHTANYLWTTTQAGAVYGGR